VFDALRRDVLAAYERLIGLELADVSVDGSSQKHPAVASAPVLARSTGPSRA
jgi:hypothetical protein